MVSSSGKRFKLLGTPFFVEVDKNSLSATLLCEEPPEEFSAESALPEVLRALREKEFATLDVRGLRNALDQVIQGEPFCFARGSEPQHGRNGSAEYHFESDPLGKAWEANESERVDYRQSQDVNNVVAGDLLVTISPPAPGTDGKDVFGHVQKARQGKPVRLIAGKNVRASEDGTQFHAETDGYVKLVGRKVFVDQRKVIDGDVCFRTGNVDYNGDVVIRGDVKETFEVRAQGSIEVMGSVDRALLEAVGDIHVHGGLHGKPGIKVVAGGNVVVGFADNAEICADGNIYVCSSLVNCRATAGAKLLFRSVGKCLIGGEVQANHGVHADSLGNPGVAVATVVRFGLTDALARQMSTLVREYRQATDDEKREAIRTEVEEIREEYEEQTGARVAVRNSVYPGVKIVSGRAVFDVRSETSRIVFVKLKDRDDITFRPYDPKKRDG